MTQEHASPKPSREWHIYLRPPPVTSLSAAAPPSPQIGHKVVPPVFQVVHRPAIVLSLQGGDQFTLPFGKVLWPRVLSHSISRESRPNPGRPDCTSVFSMSLIYIS